MLFNFVLYMAFLTIIDTSVIDESFIDEMRVWRKYEISNLLYMMSLFTTTWSMSLLLEIYFPEGIISPVVSTFVLT